MKIRSYINYIISLIVFICFLMLNLVSVEFAPQAFLTVLLNSGLAMVCWILIKNSMASQGLVSGQKNAEVMLTKREHLQTSNQVVSHKKEFQTWCSQRNSERLKQLREYLLAKSSLRYEDCFDGEGLPIIKQVPAPKSTGDKKMDRANRKKYRLDCKCLKKAKNAFVAPYIPDEIFEREKIGNSKRLFGLTIKQWKNINVFTSVIFSFIICIMLAFTQTQGKILNASQTMILIFEMCLMLASGLSFFFSGINFVCTDWRDGLIKKIRIMDEFWRQEIGSISYSEDVKNQDGSIILGKKVFNEERGNKRETGKLLS